MIRPRVVSEKNEPWLVDEAAGYKRRLTEDDLVFLLSDLADRLKARRLFADLPRN